jgi:hypothetical protein
LFLISSFASSRLRLGEIHFEVDTNLEIVKGLHGALLAEYLQSVPFHAFEATWSRAIFNSWTIMPYSTADRSKE